MRCFREVRTLGVIIWALVLGLLCQTAPGRDVKLVVRPQKVATEVGKYALLPLAASLVDGDAVPWYDKALKALPAGKAGDDQVQQYLKMPIDKLPVEKAEQMLKAYVESFKYAVQGAKCRECRWPASIAGEPAHEPQYVRLGRALRLWAHYEIAQGNHEGALLAMQTGIGMGRHLSQGPNQMQFLVGVGIMAGLCREIEELVQTEDAPNLHGALGTLPRPTVYVEKIMDSEKKAGAKFKQSGPPAGMTRAQFENELKQGEERWKTLPERLGVLAKRFDRDLALLQSVEAIRAYAASHKGQLPQTLGEITEVAVPKDPMSGAAFRYTRTGATAVLESSNLYGGKEEVVRYEITVKD